MPPRTYKKKIPSARDSTGASEPYLTDGHYLIIVESPSKCKKIEGFLGPNYQCIASKGHLREIEGLKSIDTKGDFTISFTPINNKKTHIEFMRTVISRFSHENILLATDDDREGEAIAWHICDIFGLPIERTPRILFHEITRPALLAAVAAPIQLRMNIVKAQRARQILDMLVGFKISPFLWKYLYNNKSASLSAGRCQTPALRLIYDNQQKINQKTSEIKYTTTGYFFSQHIAFQLTQSDFVHTDEVVSFLELSKTFQHRICVGSPKESTKSAPKPLNTSRLLQMASNTLHLSPKQTMMYCQILYQDGHITYMRTDSMIYSKEFVELAFHHIEKTWGSPYCHKNREKIENPKKDNPHEAIRITHIELTSVSYPKEPKIEALYRLIWRNTLESCMADAKYTCTTISISAPLERNYQHVLEIPLFLGWKIIQSRENIHENQNTTGANVLFFKSVESAGSPIQYNKIEVKTGIQHKHNHYTESSLIQTLEELGIGRPSTFSMIVDTIQSRGYVKKMDVVGDEVECTDFLLEDQVLTSLKTKKIFGNEKNKLVIQPIGILTTEFLMASFSNLFDYEYTKHMEDALDLISNRENSAEPWFNICITCNNEIKQLSKQMNSVEKKSFKINDEYTLVFTKNGPVLVKNLENGTTEFVNVSKDIEINLDKLGRNEYTIEELLETKQIILGKYENNDVLLKNGKYGPYIEWTSAEKNITRTSAKNIQKSFQQIELADVLPIIHASESGIRSPPSAPNKSILRIIDENTSIRKGKFGAYIYHKTEHMKSPQFYNMSKFKKGFAVCELQEIKDWLKSTYNI